MFSDDVNLPPCRTETNGVLVDGECMWRVQSFVFGENMEDNKSFQLDTLTLQCVDKAIVRHNLPVAYLNPHFNFLSVYQGIVQVSSFKFY